MNIGFQDYQKWKGRSHKEYNHWRRLQQGPHIVVIGGGTGLSVLLRGLKDYQGVVDQCRHCVSG